MNVGDLARLVRAPAALSVPGDVLTGAAAVAAAGLGGAGPAGAGSGGRGRAVRRLAGMTASSVLLYWAGMALNDFADRRVDAVERPERPIPSGRVRPEVAAGIATGLTAAGLAAAALADRRRGLAAAVPLAALVWAYDLVLKDTAAGPAAMAAARSMDVLMGAAGGRRAALPAAGLIGAHTYLVTTLSRREVSGSAPELPMGTLAGTGLLAALAGTGRAARSGAGAAEGRGRSGGLRRLGRTVRRVAPLAGAAAYLNGYGRAQAAAVREPSAPRIRAAVGEGIVAMIPLQATMIAARGRPAQAVVLLAAQQLARRLTRRISAT
jgi:4-hydroxybenzoate polyprenyltransferase